MISTRLELQNLLIMNINGETQPTTLKDLREETAKYFMKTPPAGIPERMSKYLTEYYDQEKYPGNVLHPHSFKVYIHVIFN